METLQYGIYTGSVEYDPNNNKYKGKILGIEDLVTYEGNDEEELKEEFETAVDIYLILCQDAGKMPETVSHAN